MSDGGAIKKLVSLCIPVHNRTYDLKHAMPYILDAANSSPPVEIALVNYNSKDDLEKYIRVINAMNFGDGVSLSYRKYTGRDHYHMAHARNLTIRLAKGELIVITSADIYFSTKYIQTARSVIDDGFDVVRDSVYKGVIMCKKQVLVDAGGYDERFEFYSPEDTDLEHRLIRRGCKIGVIKNGMIHVIPTDDEEKSKNYREKISKWQMAKLMHPILHDNDRNKTLVANEGIEWGAW